MSKLEGVEGKSDFECISASANQCEDRLKNRLVPLVEQLNSHIQSLIRFFTMVKEKIKPINYLNTQNNAKQTEKWRTQSLQTNELMLGLCIKIIDSKIIQRLIQRRQRYAAIRPHIPLEKQRIFSSKSAETRQRPKLDRLENSCFLLRVPTTNEL